MRHASWSGPLILPRLPGYAPVARGASRPRGPSRLSLRLGAPMPGPPDATKLADVADLYDGRSFRFDDARFDELSDVLRASVRRALGYG